MDQLTVRRGDAKQLNLTVTQDDQPVDLTNYKIVMSVGVANSTVKVIKKNTAAGGSDTQVYVTDAANGKVSIFLLSADTLNMFGVYDWDVVIEGTDSKEYTVASGTLKVAPRVTSAV